MAVAPLVFTNAKLVVNSVDLSDHGVDVTLDLSAADLDSTAFNAGGWTTHLAGLKSGKIDITFLQDYSASSVDATLWAAFLAGANVPVTVNPVNAANSATNPQYQFNATPLNHPGPTGKVGDLVQAKVSWVISGAVTRAVA